jgi:hypothetical protein
MPTFVVEIIFPRYAVPLYQFTIPVKLGGIRLVVVVANTSVSSVEDVTVQDPIKGEKLVLTS